MNVHTLCWLVFLIQIKNFPCNPSFPFILRGPTELTATEGSCIEIKLEATQSVNTDGAYWFWIKDPKWISPESGYSGTIIYSTDQTKRPLSPGFENRVTFTCTPNITETSFPQSQCNILICDLKKTDSGNYSFRFVGKDSKWMAKPERRLEVRDNPCPITFAQPPIVRENATITLTCSTLPSCSSPLKIEPLTHLPSEKSSPQTSTTTTSFTASWTHDGKEFTCQTSDNTDKYLIRKTNIVVEYAPKETSAMISSSRIKEGDTVTLTCSSKGRPNPTFTWFHNEEKKFSADRWPIGSIQASQSGSYYCKAKNRLDEQNSNTVTVDVTYVPEVEVEISKEPKGSLTDIKQGDKVTLTCNVKRSNPKYVEFRWDKDGQWLGFSSDSFAVSNIQPEDSGSYTCTATNTAGPGTSKPHMVQVQYRPKDTRISTGEAESRRVKVNSTFTFTCNTDAVPDAWFSWYRQTDSSQWTLMSTRKMLTLERVQRKDEACYRCNATNTIGMGDMSPPVCIQVLYPPTSVMLSMDMEVTEGQPITISCTAESFPSSRFTIMRKSSPSHQFSDWKSFQSDNTNIFNYTFTASSTDEGVYICKAANSEAAMPTHSSQRKLVVNYRPRNTRISPGEAENIRVQVNRTLTFTCNTDAVPDAWFSWYRQTDSSQWTLMSKQKMLTLERVQRKDEACYRCSATNTIGMGDMSHPVCIQVLFPPTSVMLSMDTTVTEGQPITIN